MASVAAHGQLDAYHLVEVEALPEERPEVGDERRGHRHQLVPGAAVVLDARSHVGPEHTLELGGVAPPEVGEASGVVSCGQAAQELGLGVVATVHLGFEAPRWSHGRSHLEESSAPVAPGQEGHQRVPRRERAVEVEGRDAPSHGQPAAGFEARRASKAAPSSGRVKV